LYLEAKSTPFRTTTDCDKNEISNCAEKQPPHIAGPLCLSHDPSIYDYSLKTIQMKTFFMLITMYLYLTPLACLAQLASSQDSLLNHLTGKWILQGTIAGNQTTHDIISEWILENQYLQLTEVSHEKNLDGNPLYEAKVLITWNQTSKLYDCLWLDNTGNEGLRDGAVGHSEYKTDRFEFVFKASDGSKFYTTFIYNNSTVTWQWLMDSEENNKIQPFARLTLIRSNQ
jgi:hypothetical protein